MSSVETEYIVEGTDTWNIAYAQSRDITLKWSSIALSFSGKYGAACMNGGGVSIAATANYGSISYQTKVGSYRKCSSCAVSNTGKYMVVVVEDNDEWWLSTNYGVNFSEQTGNNGTNDKLSTGRWSSVSISGDGRIIAAASLHTVSVGITTTNGIIAISTNFGDSWSYETTTGNWSSISVSRNGDYIAAVTNNVNTGSIYIKKNTGTLTKITSAPTNTMWTSISLSNTGQYMVACVSGDDSTDKGIWISATYGNTWIKTYTAETSAINFISVSISMSGQYIAACTNTDVYVSYNYGELNTWVSIGTAFTDLTAVSISGNGQFINISSTGDNTTNVERLYVYKRTMDIGSLFNIY